MTVIISACARADIQYIYTLLLFQADFSGHFQGIFIFVFFADLNFLELFTVITRDICRFWAVLG